MIITVAGTVDLRLPAERGTLHLTSGAEGEDRRAAVRATTGTTEWLRRQLVALKAGDAVTWYSVGAQTTLAWHPYSDTGDVLPMRYRIAFPVQVEFGDFEALSSWGTSWAEAEGLSIDDVEWALTATTRDRVADEVLSGAVRDATHHAEVLAQAAGQPAPRVLAIADPGLLGDAPGHGADGFEPVGFTARAMSAEAGAEQSVELSPADITVSASVHARFEA